MRPGPVRDTPLRRSSPRARATLRGGGSVVAATGCTVQVTTACRACRRRSGAASPHGRIPAFSGVVDAGVLVVGVPQWVAPIGCAIAGDLPVHRLETLADAFRDRFDRLLAGQSVRDLDTLVVAQVAATDRTYDIRHTASVDEPQRPTAQRHTDRCRSRRSAVPLPDQLEVAALALLRRLVPRIPGHRNPLGKGFASINGNHPSSSGRAAQSCISSRTLSVILEMVSFETEAP